MMDHVVMMDLHVDGAGGKKMNHVVADTMMVHEEAEDLTTAVDLGEVAMMDHVVMTDQCVVMMDLLVVVDDGMKMKVVRGVVVVAVVVVALEMMVVALVVV
eukprot:CAMPEP_0182459350 /NCGR_PEP_ID=MMETSP1319-20130603/4502_1 /TAXON_ID=172717 /ORGANISM="Bolidomonas pacifica, Strain RCC208" /LENGTH=100 /DNA_ID=CAMNT_0024658249 /DNA_START=9 /DNA_END=308 /DNA_ORIENTATION=+